MSWRPFMAMRWLGYRLNRAAYRIWVLESGIRRVVWWLDRRARFTLALCVSRVCRAVHYTDSAVSRAGWWLILRSHRGYRRWLRKLAEGIA